MALSFGVATVAPNVVACHARPNVGPYSLTQIAKNNAATWTANLPDIIKYPEYQQLESEAKLMDNWFNTKVKPYLYLQMLSNIDEPEKNITISLKNGADLDYNYWTVAPLILIQPTLRTENVYYGSGEFYWPSQDENVVPHVRVDDKNKFFSSWCTTLSHFNNDYDIHDEINARILSKVRGMTWMTITESGYLVKNKNLIQVDSIKQLKGDISEISCQFLHKKGDKYFNVLIKRDEAVR